MQNQLQIFENEEFGKVRVLEIDGAPWFVGKDVTEALGYGNGSRDINRHVDAEDRQVFQNYRNGTFEIPSRGLLIINESGLYALILSSNLPRAKAFKRWVTSIVLPSIRKHGAYINDDILEEAIKSQDFAIELFRKLQAEMGKTDALLDKVETLAPKARYCDLILHSDGVIQVSLIARDYGMTAVAFNRLLHDLGVQFRIGSAWVLYKRHADQGFTRSRTYFTPSGKGVIHTCWTQKGRLFLYETLCEAGVFPVMDIE